MRIEAEMEAISSLYYKKRTYCEFLALRYYIEKN